MEIVYSEKALKDIIYWKKAKNKAIQDKITLLIEAIIINPFTGIGKPEALKSNRKGYWSRRINLEHRIIYKVEKNRIIFASLKGHYE